MRRRNQIASLVMAAALATGCKVDEEPSTRVPAAVVRADKASSRPRWAVNPAHPGPDRPPAGRSLFDLVAGRERAGQGAYEIAFPFDAFLRQVNERAGCRASAPCVKVVLIPLGRSLQRMTASPEFFAHPRVVAAVDGEAEAGEGVASHAMLLKDRLFLGYQEQAGLIEVISYNETAGRFEFQLVNDYRAGATPRVSYARRDVCAACHQNLAPIFSRPQWAETNANERVAAGLRVHGDAFFGVPVGRGTGIPGAIDDSTDRANLFGVWQRLWRDGCRDRHCRAAALFAALQYRLAGERGFDESAATWREDFIPQFAGQWRMHWPAGLAIPNPDLPNRDPLPPATAPWPVGAAMAHVPARFEPLQPRPPLEVWLPTPSTAASDAAIAAVARSYIAGLAAFFPEMDIAALDQRLRELATDGRAQRRQYDAQCSIEQAVATLRFRCDGATPGPAVHFSGRLALRESRTASGTVEGLSVAGEPPLHQLTVTPGVALSADGTTLRVRDRERHARLADGSAIDSITLDWSGSARGAAHATVSVIDDLDPLRTAITALIAEGGPASPFAAETFDREHITRALFSLLDIAREEACCEGASTLPPARFEAAQPAVPTSGPAQPFAAFYPMCAGCHATGERSPPNFLSGTDAQVAANLRHCAPRLYARLAMWRRSPAQREKTPMPPPLALPYPHVAAPPAQVATLERISADLVRAETGRLPQLDTLLANEYEALRPCLPEPEIGGAADANGR
jgi:hypothetical protein